MSFSVDTRVWKNRLLAQPAAIAQTAKAAGGTAMVRGRTVVRANDYFCDLLGYSREELIGLDIVTLFGHPDEFERVIDETRQQIKSNGAGIVAVTLWHRKGYSIAVHLGMTPLSQDNMSAGLVMAVLDTAVPMKGELNLPLPMPVAKSGDQLFGNGPVVVFKWRNCPGYPVEYVSPNVVDILGYPVEDFLSGRILYTSIIAEDDFHRVTHELATVTEEHSVKFIHEPYRITRQDGRTIWVANYAMIVRGEDGAITHYQGYIFDVSENVKINKTLRSTLAFNRQIISGAGQGVTVYDREFRYLEFNPVMETLTGEKREDVLGKRCLDLFPVLRENGVEEILKRALAGEVVHLPEIMYESARTGKSVWVTSTYSPYRNGNGEIIGVIGVMHDITDRKRVEMALQDSDQLAKAIIYGSPIPQFIIDRNHQVTHWNAALEEISGIAAGEVIGTDLHWQAFYPQKRPCLSDLLVDGIVEAIPDWYLGKHCKSKTISGAYEATDFFPHMGGGGKWLHFTAAAILDSSGQVIGAIETLVDVTEHRKAEDALRDSERRLNELIGFLPDATFAIDSAGKVIVWNRAIEEMTGVKAADMLGKNDYEYAVPFYGKRRPILIDLALNPEDAARNEYVFVDTQGDILIAEARLLLEGKEHVLWGKATPLYDSDGKIIGALESIRDITERKQVEEALRESEDKYSRIVNTANEGILVLNAEFRTTFINSKMAALLGYPPEEMIGRPFADFLPEEDLADHELKVATRIRGIAEQYERRMRRKDGRILWTHISATPLYDAQRQFAGSFGMVADITERKQVEDALKRSEAVMRSMFEATPAGFGLIVDRVLQKVNNALCTITGYSEQELLGQSTRILYVDEEEYLRVGRELYDQMERRGLGITETRLKHKDGAIIHAILGLSPFDPKDFSAGVTATVLDITDWKRAEEALRSSEEKFSKAFHSNACLMAISTMKDGRFLDVNESFLRVLGFERDEVIGRTVLELNIWVDYSRRVALVQEAQKSGFVRQAEVDIKAESGAILKGLFSIDIVNIQGVPCTLTVMNDITDRVRVEENLKALSARNEAMLESVPDIIMEMNADKEFTWANQAGMEFFGEDIVGKKAFQYVDGEQRPLELGDLFVAGSQGVFYVENRQCRKDGQIRLLAWWCKVLRDGDGNITGALSTAHDITDQKRVQDEREDLILELENKNAELERFAYTVSHDLKAPLITISGFIGLLKKRVADHAFDRMESDMNRIFNAATKMAKLLDGLLEVSRIGRMVNSSETICLDDLIREAIEILAGRINETGVRVTVRPGLPIVVGDRPRLLEVVQNLLDNAVKYIGDQPEPVIEIGCEKKPDETAIYVRDNGIGIPPRFHEKVFGLFEQLNPGGEGSGIGLALVKRIVEYHGGRVWVESDGLGTGSTFYFTLPGRPAEKIADEAGQ